MMDAIDALGDLSKAKGDMRAGHKYKSRTADGKGGWVYTYADSAAGAAELANHPVPAGQQSASSHAAAAQKLNKDRYDAQAARAKLERTMDFDSPSDRVQLRALHADENRALQRSIQYEQRRLSSEHTEALAAIEKQEASMDFDNEDDVIHLRSLYAEAGRAKRALRRLESRSTTTKSDAIDALGDLSKAKGDMRAGHKYKSRTADGKGGWAYTYEDGSGGNRAHAIPGRSEKDKAYTVHSVPSLADRKAMSRTAPAAQDSSDEVPHATRTWAETYLHLDKKDPKLKEKVDAVIRNAAIASTVTKKHATTFQAIKNDITILSKNPVDVQGRVKTLESVLVKLTRKKHYADATQLQDISGFRVIHNTVADVRRTVAAIKDKYEVVTEDDYLETPQGAYRSYHLIVRHGGLQKEIQVRTAKQDVFANWAHESYKPHTPVQIATMRDHEPEITEYSKSASTYYWAQDTGQPTNPPSPPPCTSLVKNAFGCLEFTL